MNRKLSEAAEILRGAIEIQPCQRQTQLLCIWISICSYVSICPVDIVYCQDITEQSATQGHKHTSQKLD